MGWWSKRRVVKIRQDQALLIKQYKRNLGDQESCHHSWFSDIPLIARETTVSNHEGSSDPLCTSTTNLSNSGTSSVSLSNTNSSSLEQNCRHMNQVSRNSAMPVRFKDFYFS